LPLAGAQNDRGSELIRDRPEAEVAVSSSRLFPAGAALRATSAAG